MDKLEKWIKEKDYRAVRISNHCHGFRVELLEDFNKEITSGVEWTIDAAFDSALQAYPEAVNNVALRCIEDTKRNIREHEESVRQNKIVLKTLTKRTRSFRGKARTKQNKSSS
jgi:hypothetical protein